MEGADKLSFYEGDRILECQALCRADGDRHCIVAYFVVKRGFGRLDAFVAGTGPLRERFGVTEEFIRLFMEDMKKTSLDSFSRAPYPVEWTHVDVQSHPSLEDQIGALQQAGVQLWTDARA